MKAKYKTPYKNLLPPLSSDEFQALEADIKANGVRDPVLIDEDNNVLDGHHRLMIDPKAPTKVIKGLSRAEKEASVYRANLARRNLAPDQKAGIRAQMRSTAHKLRAEDPKKWTQRQVGAALGVAQQTVADWFGNITGRGKGSKPDARVKVPHKARRKITKRIDAGENREEVAAEFGISGRRAAQIADEERGTTEDEQQTSVPADPTTPDGTGELECCECLDGLAKLEPETVDLAFANPPFGVEEENDSYDDSRQREEWLKYFEQCRDWSKAWIAEVYRVLKPTATFWLHIGDEFAPTLMLAAQEIGFHVRNWVIWHHTFGVPCERKFSRSHSHLLYFVKDPCEFTFRGEGAENAIPDVWLFPRVANSVDEPAEFHRCHIPEQLLGRIINTCSYVGDRVLDPFAATGATLVVAKKLGRRFTGFEADENYFRVGRSRLSAAQVGDDLADSHELSPSGGSAKIGKRATRAEKRRAVAVRRN